MDRVVSLPALEGPRLPGLPGGRARLHPGRRRGAASTASTTSTPPATWPTSRVKQGGLACQQADDVAQDIAARAGRRTPEPKALPSGPARQAADGPRRRVPAQRRGGSRRLQPGVRLPALVAADEGQRPVSVDVAGAPRRGWRGSRPAGRRGRRGGDTAAAFPVGPAAAAPGARPVVARTARAVISRGSDAGRRPPPRTRRAGGRAAASRARTVVPSPGAEVTSSVPPASCARSAMPRSPKPSSRAPGVNPIPSSTTLRSIQPSCSTHGDMGMAAPRVLDDVGQRLLDQAVHG